MIKLLSIRANNFKLLNSVELRFPSSGSVLIEGRNEAGKSTLFEAVFFALFGRPLPGGSTVQDLIAYHATDGLVELEIDVRGCRFAVQRRVRRTKAGASTDARLRAFDENGEPLEEVKGAIAVNGRLQQELKLDADAFLNSCFVEQKKLEKLEGMSAKDREQSMMRLLNLERMDQEAENLRVTMEDQRALARQQQRLRLAEVIAEMPGVVSRGRELKTALEVADLKDTLAQLEDCQRAREQAGEQLAVLEEPIRALEGRIARVEAVRGAETAARLSAAQLGKVEGYLQQADEARAELLALDTVEREDLPAMLARRGQLAVLRARYARLLALSAQCAEAEADAEDVERRLSALSVSAGLAAEAEARLVAMKEPLAAVHRQMEAIADLHRAVAAAELAAARLQTADDARAEIGRLAVESNALEALEKEGVPALESRLASLRVLNSQWRRIGALQRVLEQVRQEAQAENRRLASIEEARQALAADEQRLLEGRKRVEALAEQLAAASAVETAASLRLALEDWQAAYHAKTSLYEVEAGIHQAQREVAEAEAKAADARGQAEALRRAAASRVPRLAAGIGGAAIAGIAVVAVHLTALLPAALVLLLYAIAQAVQWRAAAGKAKAAAGSLPETETRVRDAQNALLRLQGQHENARASQGAAAGRLEVAQARLEALGEPEPRSLDEAACRLAELPEPEAGLDALRENTGRLRQQLAAADAAVAEQEKGLEVRRAAADAESQTKTRSAVERLERRSARLADIVLDRWVERASARAERLGMEVAGDAATEAAAAQRAMAEAEASLRVAQERLATRPQLQQRLAVLDAAVRQAVEEANATSPEGAVLATRADADAWKASLEARLGAEDEAGARAEMARLEEAGAKAESDRRTAENESARIRRDLAERFHAPAEWSAAEPVVRQGLAGLRARAGRVARVVARWSERAAVSAERLGVEVAGDLEAGRQAASVAEAAAAASAGVMRRRLEGRSALRERVARLEAAAAEERRHVDASRPAIVAVRPDAAPLASRAQADEIRADLVAELEALNEAATREELRQQCQARSAAENARFAADKEAQRLTEVLKEQAARLRCSGDIPLTREALSETMPGWGAAEPADRPALQEEYDDRRTRYMYLREMRAELAQALGLEPDQENVDVEQERAALAELEHDHAVRRKAAEIIRLARDRIVQKVLPYTIEHMRRILPAITSDRYHDARLTDDYKIEVWDERAGMWKKKDIFSGGTRDQFSLALRLAFAMATLPQERGAAPGFIFLDEPLSSFDVERSDALMYLLTKGEIAQTFDQILVISHSQTIAANGFDHRLRLDTGKVAEASDDLRLAFGDVEQPELLGD